MGLSGAWARRFDPKGSGGIIAVSLCALCNMKLADAEAAGCKYCGAVFADKEERSGGKKSSGLIASAIAGGALVISGVLPWMTSTAVFVGTIDRSGFALVQSDSVLVMILGALGILLSLVSRARGKGSTIPIIVGLLGCCATIVGIYQMSNILNRSRELSDEEFVISADVGVGLWMVVFFGIVMTLGGFIAAGQRAKSKNRNSKK